MTKLLAVWIILQLLVIGYGMTIIRNQIVDKTFKCPNKQDHISPWVTMTFPLALFVQYSEFNDYCK